MPRPFQQKWSSSWNTPVEVESVAPFGGPVLVRVAGSQYALGREVAGKILVRA